MFDARLRSADCRSSKHGHDDDDDDDDDDAVMLIQVRARSDVAVMTVHVDDINDHSPTFVFPSGTNNTVHVSSAAVSSAGSGSADAGRHLLVAVCRATDADDGANARLTYGIANVSSTTGTPVASDLFRIGRTSGRLTMRVGRAGAAAAARTVSGSGGSENATLTVVVRARDDGWPSLSTTATLYVIVVNTPAAAMSTLFDAEYWTEQDWTKSAGAAGSSDTQNDYRSVLPVCLVCAPLGAKSLKSSMSSPACLFGLCSTAWERRALSQGSQVLPACLHRRYYVS